MVRVASRNTFLLSLQESCVVHGRGDEVGRRIAITALMKDRGWDLSMDIESSNIRASASSSVASCPFHDTDMAVSAFHADEVCDNTIPRQPLERSAAAGECPAKEYLMTTDLEKYGDRIKETPLWLLEGVEYPDPGKQWDLFQYPYLAVVHLDANIQLKYTQRRLLCMALYRVRERYAKHNEGSNVEKSKMRAMLDLGKRCEKLVEMCGNQLGAVIVFHNRCVNTPPIF